ncbi:MAG: radical SAM family heme chaperone HemW [Prevotella sp.]|nr:radical SAM family heme chaperone HemW [Prevotella sp.]
MAGLYIHIPFCKSRCIYCNFYSTTLSSLQDMYVDSLCKEMEIRAEHPNFFRFEKTELKTIYLGGGTPSLLSKPSFEKIFLYINKVYRPEWGSYSKRSDDKSPIEVTVECNPDDINDQFCDTIHQLPINRISMGVQTFDDTRLRFLRRRHTAKDIQHAIERLRKRGIHNISIDLIFGFPSQTIDEWEADLHHALSLDVEHISAYSLTYEPGTPLFQMAQGGNITPVDEGLSADMYDLLINILTQNGYEHYEISNFAKHTTTRDYRSKHNSSYWQDVPYTGIGAAAHSYDLQTRSWNTADIHAYIDAIRDGDIPCEAETIDPKTHYNDLITTALRTREGLSFGKVPAKYKEYLLANARRHLATGLLVIEEDRIHLTRKGLFISDDIMSDLIIV